MKQLPEYRKEIQKYYREIAIGIALVVMAAGWVYVSQQDYLTPLREQQGPTLEKRFEDALNEFLGSVNDKAQAYKAERKIVSELVKPENLSAPDYIEQNREMMTKLIPALHLKIDELMLVFKDTETGIEELLQDQPPEKRDVIFAKWQEVKQEQAGLYVDFFAIEEDILRLYEELMNFYYTKKDVLTVDPAQGTMVFQDANDASHAAEIKARIADLLQKEAALLSRP